MVNKWGKKGSKEIKKSSILWCVISIFFYTTVLQLLIEMKLSLDYLLWLNSKFCVLSDRQGGPSAPEGVRPPWTSPRRQVEPVWRSLHRLMLRGLHCKNRVLDVRTSSPHLYVCHWGSSQSCVCARRWRSGTSRSVESNRTSPRPGRLWLVTPGGWGLLSGIRLLRICCWAPPTTTRSGTSLVGVSVSQRHYSNI